MSTTSGPLPADASLHLLADHVLSALLAEEIEPSLLHVKGVDADGFDLGLLPLDGDHPSDFLLGLSPPDDWYAVGFVTRGWVFHTDERSSPDRRHTRIGVVTLGTRTGELVHRSQCDDPTLDAQLSSEQPVGEQVDLLRRCFALPTDHPPTEAGTFWCIEWLGRILSTDPPPRRWDEILDAHPAMQLLTQAARSVDDDTLEVVAAFHRVCNWTRLRQLAADGAWPAPGLTAREAAWLDDGSFARWILNRCPSLHALRIEADAQLPAPLAGQLHDFLADAGIPDRAWPEDLGEGQAA